MKEKEKKKEKEKPEINMITPSKFLNGRKYQELTPEEQKKVRRQTAEAIVKLIHKD